MEKNITNYLIKTYNPEAILLAGSRAKGLESPGSDWDIWILEPTENQKGGFFNIENELLDITFKTWPEDDKFLTLPFGPLWPVKVLYNNSSGKLTNLLTKTEQAFNSGPLNLYKESCLERLSKLNRWQSKMITYQNQPAVQFYYAGIFYEFAIRVWFELQNRWPLPPAQAVKVFNKEDEEFYSLLAKFGIDDSMEKVRTANLIIERLQFFTLTTSL